MNVSIVIDCSNGDCGKGKMVNSLVNSPDDLVIRFSGGPNAGHTVIYNGIKHTFSSFGSGTLKGAASYFDRNTLVCLSSLQIEKEILNEKGVSPRLTIHPLAKLITPYDVLVGQRREQQKKHGSCGKGIFTTEKRNLDGYQLYAIDLLCPKIFKEKLKNIGNLYYGVSDLNNVRINQEVDFFMFSYESFIKDSNLKVDAINLENYVDNHIIFEGSQGILLDKDHGIFPNVTYANTTSKNIFNNEEYKPFLDANINRTNIYYMTRCYQTRHGNGYMSNEDEEKPVLINTDQEINVTNPWQGNFRITELDYDLLNYSLFVDSIYSNPYGELKKNIVVTCGDQRPDFVFDESLIENKENYNFLYYPGAE